MIKEGGKLINTRNWTELVRPEGVVRDPRSTDIYGKFICEPLERGFGTTVGNALRRVLLSSLQGSAIVSARVMGVQHEFTVIPGVIEDVTDVVLNLKQVRFLMTTPEPQRLLFSANSKGAVTAAAIQENQNVKVLNPELHIATLSEDLPLEMELEVRMGKGYVPAELHEGLETEIGLIALDASFSPISKVAYAVEPARVGQMTNYDKLVMEIWSDGSITPDDALAYSAKILKDQLTVFINFDEQKSDVQFSAVRDSEMVNDNLFKSIDELELPVRASNCLKGANIKLVGELVQKTEGDMLKTKNFGRKSLEDIRRVLNELGLDFGMHIPNFEAMHEQWSTTKEEEDEA